MNSMTLQDWDMNQEWRWQLVVKFIGYSPHRSKDGLLIPISAVVSLELQGQSLDMNLWDWTSMGYWDQAGQEGCSARCNLNLDSIE